MCTHEPRCPSAGDTDRTAAHVISSHPEQGGALPRKELHEAAEQLTASQAGLIAVGEPSIEKNSTRRLRVRPGS